MGTRLVPELPLVDGLTVAVVTSACTVVDDDGDDARARRRHGGLGLDVRWKGVKWTLDDTSTDNDVHTTRAVPLHRVESYEVELIETAHRPPRVRVIHREDEVSVETGRAPLACEVRFRDGIVPGCRYVARVRWRAAPPPNDVVSEWSQCETTLPSYPRLEMCLPVHTFARAVSGVLRWQ